MQRLTWQARMSSHFELAGVANAGTSSLQGMATAARTTLTVGLRKFVANGSCSLR